MRWRTSEVHDGKHSSQDSSVEAPALKQHFTNADIICARISWDKRVKIIQDWSISASGWYTEMSQATSCYVLREILFQARAEQLDTMVNCHCQTYEFDAHVIGEERRWCWGALLLCSCLPQQEFSTEFCFPRKQRSYLSSKIREPPNLNRKLKPHHMKTFYQSQHKRKLSTENNDIQRQYANGNIPYTIQQEH